MRNLLDFLVRYHHWFLFLILEVASVVLLFRYNSYQGSVWFSSANTVAGMLLEQTAKLENFLSLPKVNQELTTTNIYLEQEVERLRQQLADVTRDTSANRNNQLAILRSFNMIPAKVVDNSIDKPDNLMTIDKGSLDGVRKDMGVACGNGIVGIVYMVGLNYSVVIPVLSRHSHISCAIQGRGYFGYLNWDAGKPDIAYLDDIPRHAKFRLKDKIVTSGYSSVFPPGIMVGEVLHVYNSRDGLSYRLQVKLSTDFGNLRDVCVIDDAAMHERIQLLRAAQDSIKPKEAN